MDEQETTMTEQEGQETEQTPVSDEEQPEIIESEPDVEDAETERAVHEIYDAYSKLDRQERKKYGSIEDFAEQRTTQKESEPPEKPVEQPAPAPAPTSDWETRYKELQSLQGRQAQELGDLRRFQQTTAPLLERLNTDPNFRSHVLNYGTAPAHDRPVEPEPVYDPENPESVGKFIETQTAKQVQEHFIRQQKQYAEQQRAMQHQAVLNTWNQAVQTDKQKHVSAGLSEEDLNKAVSGFTQDYMKGNIYGIAVKLATHDKLIADAEKRGYEKAVKEITNKQKTIPKRGVSVTPTKAGESTVRNPADMTPDEIAEEMQTLDPDSKRAEQLIRFVEKQVPPRRHRW